MFVDGVTTERAHRQNEGLWEVPCRSEVSSVCVYLGVVSATAEASNVRCDVMFPFIVTALTRTLCVVAAQVSNQSPDRPIRASRRIWVAAAASEYIFIYTSLLLKIGGFS